MSAHSVKKILSFSVVLVNIIVDPFGKRLKPLRMQKKEQKRSDRCLNCGTAAHGNFCQKCGQPSDTAGYTFGSFFREFFTHFTAVNTVTIFRTFFYLTTQPGYFLRDYLSGMRVGFAGPVKYFFYAFFVELTVRGFLIWATHDKQFESEGYRDINLQILDLFSTFFWGFLWWAFYRRSGLNFTENSVCALYFVAQMGFFSVVFLLISVPFASNQKFYFAVAILEFIVEVVYAFFFARRLFRDPLWKVVPKQIALTILYALLTVGLHTAAATAHRYVPPEISNPASVKKAGLRSFEFC